MRGPWFRNAGPLSVRILTLTLVAVATAAGLAILQHSGPVADEYWRRFFPQYARICARVDWFAAFLAPLFFGIAAASATALLGVEVMFRRLRRSSLQANAQLDELGKRMTGIADSVDRLRAADAKMAADAAALRRELEALREQADARRRAAECAAADPHNGVIHSLADLAGLEEDVETAFDPVRTMHLEALTSIRAGELPEAATLLRRALQWAGDGSEAGVSRAVLRYDLARTLAMQAETDPRHRPERLRLALDELQRCFSDCAVELDFRLLADIEEGGPFHALAVTAPFDKAIDELLLGFRVA